MFGLFKKREGKNHGGNSNETSTKRVQGLPGTQQEYDKNKMLINSLRGTLFDTKIGTSEQERNLIKEKIETVGQRLDELVAQGFGDVEKQHYENMIDVTGNNFEITQPRHELEVPEVTELDISAYMNTPLEELLKEEARITQEIMDSEVAFNSMRNENIIDSNQFSSLKKNITDLKDALITIQVAKEFREKKEQEAA